MKTVRSSGSTAVQKHFRREHESARTRRMAAKETTGAKRKGGRLGWLRGGKQAEETGRVPVVRVGTTGSGPAPVAPAPVSMLQKDVAARHVDKGEIARGGMGSIRKVFDTNL